MFKNQSKYSRPARTLWVLHPVPQHLKGFLRATRPSFLALRLADPLRVLLAMGEREGLVGRSRLLVSGQQRRERRGDLDLAGSVVALDLDLHGRPAPRPRARPSRP